MMMRKMLAIPVAGALMSAALVSAQDQPVRPQPGQSQENQRQPGQARPGQAQPGQKQNQQAADQATRPMTDQTLAACVVIDNQAEVAAATMAQGKVQHDEVKKFVGTLIEDHKA